MKNQLAIALLSALLVSTFGSSLLEELVERLDAEVNQEENLRKTASKRAVSTATIEAISTLAAGVLATGTSVAASAAGHHSYGVSMKMEIENYTKWPMAAPISHINAGQIAVPAGPVLPAGKEAMLAHKTGGSATGSYGTVSWEITNGQRAVVMWSAPYSFDFHSNWLAVGILSDSTVDQRQAALTDDMYYYSGNWQRGEFYYHSTPVKFCNRDFCIKGVMGTSHKADVKISVFPKNQLNLSHNVKTFLDQNNIDVINE